jgi:hypothetical protein
MDGCAARELMYLTDLWGIFFILHADCTVRITL